MDKKDNKGINKNKKQKFNYMKNNKDEIIVEKTSINLKNSKLKINKSLNSLQKSNNLVYPEIKQTQETKTKFPICSKCFRLLYIFFDYIPNYISTICPYCENISMYKYNEFNQNLKNEESQILDSICKNCCKSFVYSDRDNIYNLIEEESNNFIILCNNCLFNNRKLREKYSNKKIIEFQDLINHKPYIYEKNNSKNIESNEENENNKINSFNYLYNYYEKNYNFLNSLKDNIPFLLRKKVEKKLNLLNLDLSIKRFIKNYFNEFNIFIMRNNMIFSINSFLDISSLKLSELNDKKILNLKDKISLLEKFLKLNKNSIRILNKDYLKDKYKYSKLTKSFINIEGYIEEECHSTEEILLSSYSNILKIDYKNEKPIKFNITAKDCQCGKLVPISYNYNTKNFAFNYQDIILYDLNNDNRIYYGVYNIDLKELSNNSLVSLINEHFIKCLKIILINKGLDLFILTKTSKNSNDIYKAYYIANYNSNPIIKKYEILYDYNLIYNDDTICIQTKNKIILINRLIIREVIIYNKGNNLNNLNNNNIDIDELIQIQNKILEDLGGDMNILIQNVENMNLAPFQSSYVFQNNKEKAKFHYEDICKINEHYFVVLSSKIIKAINKSIKYFIYISLFNFKTFEENTKIEVDTLELNDDKVDFSSIELKDNNLIIIKIKKSYMSSSNIIEYYFFFNENELIKKNN